MAEWDTDALRAILDANGEIDLPDATDTADQYTAPDDVADGNLPCTAPLEHYSWDAVKITIGNEEPEAIDPPEAIGEIDRTETPVIAPSDSAD